MDEKVAPGSSWKRLIGLYLPIVAVGSVWKFMENANDRFQELPSATCNFWLGVTSEYVCRHLGRKGE